MSWRIFIFRSLGRSTWSLNAATDVIQSEKCAKNTYFVEQIFYNQPVFSCLVCPKAFEHHRIGGDSADQLWPAREHPA